MDTIQKQDGHVTESKPIATMNLWQRLNAIKKAVPYVRKDEKKVDGMYNAVTHDAVTAATRDSFIEHGVLVLPTELKSVCVDSGMVTSKGNPIIRFEATYRILFMNMDVPTERESVDVTAHALDQGDKAPGKALSYATKAALLKVLQIETGVDDEGREQTKPKENKDILTAPITPLSGVEDNISAERKPELDKLFSLIVDFKDANDMQGAHDAYYGMKDADEMVYIWSKLKPHSAFRSALKKYHKETPNGV